MSMPPPGGWLIQVWPAGSHRPHGFVPTGGDPILQCDAKQRLTKVEPRRLDGTGDLRRCCQHGDARGNRMKPKLSIDKTLTAGPALLAVVTAGLGGYALLSGENGSGSILRWTIIVIIALCLLAAVAQAWMARSLARALTAAAAHLTQVAQGDLTKDVAVELHSRADEIGVLARAKQNMLQNLRQMVTEVSGSIQMLSTNSADLSSSSTEMSHGLHSAYAKAHHVASSADEMSTNVLSVAAGMEQATTNLTTIATGTEEMTATIGEIAGNAEKARRITGEANQQATRITDQMSQLGAAAQEIGKVTETITEISSQTNLLALNATIEAARAGAAGKGFAVVANEIKELAQQTADATKDIKGRIENVQGSTASGIAEIARVSQTIHEVSDIVSSIAAAIEEQSAVTKDISRNITEASTGVRDANKRMAETSVATSTIATDIAEVDRATSQMAASGEQVRTSASGLSKVSEKLQTAVSRFRVAGGNQKHE